MKRCVIFSGGDFSYPERYREYLDGTELVIAADSGYKHAAEAGVRVDFAVGDFDSLGYVPKGVRTEAYNAKKDDTDTMLAVKLAKEKGAKEIIIFGALGGRYDHVIANIQTLVYCAKRGVKAAAADSENEITAVFPGEYVFLKREPFSFSLFSAGDCADGITLSGVEYPLDNASLSCDFPLGISNVITDSQARLSFKSGILLVCRSKL